MPDDLASPIGTDGQAAADSTGTPAPAPDTNATSGQAAQSEPATDSFIDPSAIPDELQDKYKLMQGSYTRKMQEIATQRKELEGLSQLQAAYRRDPQAVIRQLAQQHGLTIAQAQQVVQQQQASAEPESWDQVYQIAEERARAKIMAEFEPFIGSLREMKTQSVETQLDQIDPLWRDHEPAMREMLNKHPTLSNDLPTLYELSLPKDVRESRYTQKALAKVRNIQSAAQVSGPSTKTKTTPAAPKVSNFDEAVAAARARLAGR